MPWKRDTPGCPCCNTEQPTCEAEECQDSVSTCCVEVVISGTTNGTMNCGDVDGTYLCAHTGGTEFSYRSGGIDLDYPVDDGEENFFILVEMGTSGSNVITEIRLVYLVSTTVLSWRYTHGAIPTQPDCLAFDGVVHSLHSGGNGFCTGTGSTATLSAHPVACPVPYPCACFDGINDDKSDTDWDVSVTIPGGTLSWDGGGPCVGLTRCDTYLNGNTYVCTRNASTGSNEYCGWFKNNPNACDIRVDLIRTDQNSCAIKVRVFGQGDQLNFYLDLDEPLTTASFPMQVPFDSREAGGNFCLNVADAGTAYVEVDL